MNSLTTFAFFCTEQRGWETEDYLLLASLVIALAGVMYVNGWVKRYAKGRAWKAVRITTTVLAVAVILVALAGVIWMASC